jgi:3-carboxy-cis,cis-muconate cycloisomerase
VSEASAPGKGGSSAMPQKQNPVDAMLALAAAQQVPGLVATILSAMPQEHERAVGGWQAEWVTIPALFRATSGALSHTVAALSGLRVDAERMRQNLASVGTLMAESLSMALAAQHGRPAAQKLVRRLVEQAQAEQRSLAAVARADSQVRAALTPDALEQALDPQRYLGSTEALIERALAEYATLRIDEV